MPDEPKASSAPGRQWRNVVGHMLQGAVIGPVALIMVCGIIDEILQPKVRTNGQFIAECLGRAIVLVACAPCREGRRTQRGPRWRMEEDRQE
jgi:hypothetical protein